MDGIGEINRRGPARQLDHLPFGGEAKDLIGIHLQLDRLEKIFVIFLGIKLLGQLRNPLGGIDGKGVLAAHAVPVGPMRRNAGFGHIVHLAGADLNFDPLAIAT